MTDIDEPGRKGEPGEELFGGKKGADWGRDGMLVLGAFWPKQAVVEDGRYFAWYLGSEEGLWKTATFSVSQLGGGRLARNSSSVSWGVTGKKKQDEKIGWKGKGQKCFLLHRMDLTEISIQ